LDRHPFLIPRGETEKIFLLLAPENSIGNNFRNLLEKGGFSSLFPKSSRRRKFRKSDVDSFSLVF